MKVNEIDLTSLDVATLPSVSLEDKASLPNIAGIYFVCDALTLYYIGQSRNLGERWKSHEKIKSFKKIGNCCVRYFAVSNPDLLVEIENFLICQFLPLYNCQMRDGSIKSLILEPLNMRKTKILVAAAKLQAELDKIPMSPELLDEISADFNKTVRTKLKLDFTPVLLRQNNQKRHYSSRCPLLSLDASLASERDAIARKSALELCSYFIRELIDSPFKPGKPGGTPWRFFSPRDAVIGSYKPRNKAG